MEIEVPAQLLLLHVCRTRIGWNCRAVRTVWVSIPMAAYVSAVRGRNWSTGKSGIGEKVKERVSICACVGGWWEDEGQ